MTSPRVAKVKRFLKKVVQTKRNKKARAQAMEKAILALPVGQSRSQENNNGASPLSNNNNNNMSPVSNARGAAGASRKILRVANALNNNNNNNNNNGESKSNSSAEGTRRVKPGKGVAKSNAEIKYAVAMKRAKTLLNQTLKIKSMPPEFNPLVTIMRKNYASSANRNAAIQNYVEKVRTRREKAEIDKEVAREAKAVAAAKPPKAPAKAKAKAKTPVSESKANSPPKAKGKSEKQLKLAANQSVARSTINDALGIKATAAEINQLVSIMRAAHNSNADRTAAINKFVRSVEKSRANATARKPRAKKAGNATRKNRRS